MVGRCCPAKQQRSVLPGLLPRESKRNEQNGACPQPLTVHDEHLLMVQNQWYHFGIGAPPILVYFSPDLNVHWGYAVLTHGHLNSPREMGPVRTAWLATAGGVPTHHLRHPRQKLLRLRADGWLLLGNLQRKKSRSHCVGGDIWCFFCFPFVEGPLLGLYGGNPKETNIFFVPGRRLHVRPPKDVSGGP